MPKIIANNYIYCMVIFTIFFDELFYTVILSRGAYAESGIKQYEAILYSVLTYPVLLKYYFMKSFNKSGRTIITILFFILVFYYITSVFYGNPPDKYNTYLLAYGSESIPAAFLGVLFANSLYAKRINKMLPFIVFPSALLIGTIGLRAALMGEIVHENSDDSGGLNYQVVSYFMAFAYTYSIYLSLFAEFGKSIKWIVVRLGSLVLALFSAVACLMGGGRGAFLLIILVTIMLLFHYIKIKGMGLPKLSIFLAIVFMIIIITISYFGVMESAGMARVLDNMSDAGQREDLYVTAFDAFLSSPILGNGLGSVWWKVGFYSHNMILDFLVEVGLIGTLFFIVIIWKSICILYKSTEDNSINFLMLLVLICALVHGMFSGYWIGQMKLFFVCSFAFVKACKSKNLKKRYLQLK